MPPATLRNDKPEGAELAPSEKASHLEIHYVDLSTLTPADYNPRKMSPKAKKDIVKSIEKFGMIDPIVVNRHPTRANVIVGGHQRHKILKELGYKTVPVVYVNLPEPEERELNLRLNRNHAEWDFDALRTKFDFTFLENAGFTAKELGETQSAYEQKLLAIGNDQADTPIVPQFSEKYEMICVFITNEIDLNYFRNVLALPMHKSYKNQTKGETFVVTASTLQTAIERQVEIARLGSVDKSAPDKPEANGALVNGASVNGAVAYTVTPRVRTRSKVGPITQQQIHDNLAAGKPVLEPEPEVSTNGPARVRTRTRTRA